MRRLLPLLGLITVLGVSAAPSTEGCMPAPDYAIEILVDGRPLPTLAGKYVEATKDREYAIRLTNRTGRRVAAALSVDGLNVIDAKRTSAREARKWILDPWQSITLEGWQVSAGTARRFFFTTEAKSYGRWLGRTEDLGVISAAFFRERPVAPPPAPISERSARADADAPTSAQKQQEHAGTGIGREVDHRVVEVAFDAEPSPASVVTLRYEYRDALVRLGVLPSARDALARRERATGFSDTGFAPDPHRK
jgi:hypothetical protein